MMKEVMKVFNDKTIQYPIQTIQDNIVKTMDGAIWGVYKIDYDYLSINNIKEYVNYIDNISDFLTIKGYKYDINLYPREFDFDKHMQKTVDNYVKGTLAEEGAYYFKRATDILKDEAFSYEYDVVLQVKLNVSDKEIPDNVTDYIKKLSSRIMNDINKFIMKNDVEEISIENAKDEEKKFLLTGRSYLILDKANSEQINRYLYYDFHRTEGIQKQSHSEYKITEGILKNEKGYMTIEHNDKTEYLCFLPFSKLPAKTYGFKFVDNLISNFNFPIDIKINIDYEEKQKNLKMVRKYKKRLQWFDMEIKNDIQLDEDEVVTMASERLEYLIDDLKKGNTELLYLSIMLCVSADSLELLNERVKKIENSLGTTQFVIERPMVDQLVLFHKAMLCSDVEYNYFEQICDPRILAQSGFNLTHKVGNNYGFPLGQNITGCGIKRIKDAPLKNNGIVFNNPLLTKYDIDGAKHTNGNMLISGPPGSGKSAGVKNMFMWCSFFGAKSLYIDPKNEYRRNFEKAVQKYGDSSKHLKSIYEKMNFVHLSSEDKYKGALDPLIFLEGEIAFATAKQILMQLGNVTENRKEVNIITSAIKSEMTNSKRPTLTGAVERIRKLDEEEALELAEFISNYNSGLGKMLFGDETSNTLTFDNQITVLGIQGLSLPKETETNTKVINDSHRISLAIMTAISKYIHIFSRDYEEDALMIVDEAWIFKASHEGEELINEMLRTGRSLKTDVWLITQAFDDYNTDTMKELIGCKMAYRPKSDKVVDKLLEFFGIDENDENRNVVSNLSTGICLFEDYKGRVEVIANDIMFDEWFDAFKTTDKENKMLVTEQEHYN